MFFVNGAHDVDEDEHTFGPTLFREGEREREMQGKRPTHSLLPTHN